MSATRIRVTSQALGRPALVNVMIYDTQAEMLAAAKRYNGNEHSEQTWGVCQLRVFEDDDGTVTVWPTVRMVRGQLGTSVVTHEMHHATTAIYGAWVASGGTTDDGNHLTHYNEPFAYLHGEMCSRLVDRLHALGYYDPEGDE